MRFVVAIALLSAFGCTAEPSPRNDGGDGSTERDSAATADAPTTRDDSVGADASVDLDAIPPADSGATVALPPVNAPFDYQLGGAYTPPTGVRIVTRDRNDPPAAGLYNVCYVNGFQIQPDEVSFWQSNHADLILRDSAGNPVVDPNWNEMLIDVSTAAKRTAVASVVNAWIAGCARAGFAAVDIDNLDSYSRSHGLLTADDAVATMRLFADAAHANALAIAQKNSAEIVGRRAEMATDFAVAEECNRYAECGTYTGAYGDHVLVIEYRRADFTTGCSAYPNLSIVLRDLNLVTPAQSGYVYDGC